MTSPRVVKPSRKAVQRYDYRGMNVEGVAFPRAYQPRFGGPPLLFMTDIRMTILVTLALADGPVRQKNLWKHIGKSAKTALYPLLETGIVAMWDLGPSRKFVALDPCHPAAEPLKKLLQVIGETYVGFSKPDYHIDDHDAGDPPRRPRRLRDVRKTFGDRLRTMTLLCVHLRPDLVGVDVARIVPYVTPHAARDVLFMYRCFGLLTMRYIVRGKRRGFAFRFDEKNPIVPHVQAVLAALVEAMPQWVIREERQRSEPIPKRTDRHDGRRKPKRWKW